MSVIQLRDTALFSLAADLYGRKVHEVGLHFCCKKNTEEVSKLVPIIYPQLPATIERNIQETITVIGAELSNMSKTLLDINSIINVDSSSFLFKKAQWTSYFTVNRMKTICALSEECVTVDNVTYPSWVETYFMKLSEVERLDANSFFGKYSLHFFFHWICYSRPKYFLLHESVFQRYGLRRERREFEIFFHFSRYHDLYVNNTAVENMFRYSVIMGDVSSVTQFFSLLPMDVRIKNASVMATFIIKRYESLGHVDVTKNEISSTFLHLWQHLHHNDRMNIVQTYFNRFFEFLLHFPGTESLVCSVKWYRPSSSRKANRRFLEKAAAEIPPDCNEYEKYRKVFILLFRKVEMMLCEIDVFFFLEKFLSAKDIHSSVEMMKAMSVTKKKRILGLLHKIWQDLWKESIDVDTFMTFFIEVQSEMLRDDAINYQQKVML